jgi:hypothetical protein
VPADAGQPSRWMLALVLDAGRVGQLNSITSRAPTIRP